MSERKPVDYDELFPGRFLKAGLLRGKHVTLTIASVDIEALPQDRGPDRQRGIVTFERTDKQLVLNSTNAQCIRAMFGRKVQDWVGKRLTLKPDVDKFGRDKVDCIRVAGSPDIEATMTCEVQLPRKAPRTVTLEKTGASREPGSDDT